MDALASAIAPERVPDDTIAKLTAPSLAWPNNVPSTEKSITLMYDAARLPAILQAPTLELLTAFTEKNLAMPPDDVGVEEWLKALAVTWRLKVAGTLAAQARTHDEKGLQKMFDEAAGVREWLLELANKPGFASQLEAQALRGLLQAAWGSVLESAPPPPAAAPQRPAARTGKTGIHRGLIPAPARPSAPPAFEPAGPAFKIRGKLLLAAFVATLAVRLFFVESDLKVPAHPEAELIETSVTP